METQAKILAMVLRGPKEAPTEFRARCSKALDIIRRESGGPNEPRFRVERFARAPGGCELIVGACHAWSDEDIIIPSDECLIAKVPSVLMSTSFIYFDVSDLRDMQPFRTFQLCATNQSNGREWHVREGTYESLKLEAQAMNDRGFDYWIKDDPALASEQSVEEIRQQLRPAQ